MKCPHCRIAFHERFNSIELMVRYNQEPSERWSCDHLICPECKRPVILLVLEYVQNGQWQEYRRTFIHPIGHTRPSLPLEVPEKYREDYDEACACLDASPKASAALSRRCLQHIIHEELRIHKGNLYDEIQEVIDQGLLTAQLHADIDYIRKIGNASAHALRCKVTGEILPVEPEEAAWTLDVLELLFDYLFVQPAASTVRRAALDAKFGRPVAKLSGTP